MEELQQGNTLHVTNLASVDHVVHPLSLCLVVALLQLLDVITYVKFNDIAENHIT